MLIGNANTKNEVEIKEIKNKLTIEFKIQKIKRMILLSFLLEKVGKELRKMMSWLKK